jgi:hypothetical protein
MAGSYYAGLDVRQRLVACVVLASLVGAVGIAATARAAGDARTKEHRFTLVLRGSMVTTWSVPRAPFQDTTITDQTGQTCGRWWVEGAGRQEVTFSLRAPVSFGVGGTIPKPASFERIPWHEDRQGKMVIEAESLRSCGGTFRLDIGGGEGDCGRRDLPGYVQFGREIVGGFLGSRDFTELYRNCPILPGSVQYPSGGLDWFAEEPNHLVVEYYNQGWLPFTRGKLPPPSAFRACANKRLVGRFDGTNTHRGIVDAQSGDQVPAGGPARWTSTTVISVELTYTRTAGCG